MLDTSSPASPLVPGAKTIDGLKTTTLIAGGLLGTVYELRNSVTTSDSQVIDYTVEVEIKQL